MTQGWIIGSKNVSILIRNLDDLDFYIKLDENKKTEFSKYDFVIKFAQSWFKIVDVLKTKNLLSSFIKEIDGFTLVGENIDDNLQHIKLYTENEIQFYALVKNDSYKVCENIDYTKNLLTKYGLKVVEVTKVCKVDNITDFYIHMNKLYSMILKSNVDQEGEGNVVYFSSFDGEIEEVVSLAKLKTFEYRIYRALREKLKVFVRDINKSYQSILKKLKKQAKEFVKEETEKIELNTVNYS